MKSNGLHTVAQCLVLAGVFSCSRPADVLPPTTFQTRIAFIYQPTSDFYSSMAVPENQVGSQAVQPAEKWGEGHIALFSNSKKSIGYMLNNRLTYTSEAVRKVLRKHKVQAILVRENKAKAHKTFVSNYTD